MTPPLGLAGDHPADLGGQLSGLGSGEALGHRGGRQIERRQLLHQALDPLRVGLLVDAVEGRDATPLQVLGHLLVGEDHQVLDQPMGLAGGHRFGPDNRAVAIELELGLERLDLE